MLAIFKREMRSYFTGIIGYAFLVIYLVAAGVLFSYTTLFAMSANVTTYFTLMLIFAAVILPILTMKSFSEERKTKTEQLILTAPVSIPGMVVGKFLASYAMFAGATLFTSLYFLLLTPYAPLKVWTLVGNIVALLLVGMVFIAIGLFVSSLTENQLSAAVGTIAIILGLLGVDEETIIRDYLLSFQAVSGNDGTNSKSMVAQANSFISGLASYAPEGATLKEQVEGFLSHIGITAEQMQKKRDILLEE